MGVRGAIPQWGADGSRADCRGRTAVPSAAVPSLSGSGDGCFPAPHSEALGTWEPPKPTDHLEWAGPRFPRGHTWMIAQEPQLTTDRVAPSAATTTSGSGTKPPG